MKYTGPKARRVRRQQMNIYAADKYDKILQKKPYGPGKSAKFRPSRPSEYSRQLLEKQRARDMYGLSEKQFQNLYAEASTQTGQTGDAMKQMLERRLDNVVYRAGLARTRLQSRQFVGHGLFMVNGKRVTTPSYRVRPGETITIRSQSKDSPVFATIVSANEKYLPPKWIKVDSGALKIEVITLPEPADAEQALDMRQIIEFYSRN
jgi:small subunit ribosomal protein S4